MTTYIVHARNREYSGTVGKDTFINGTCASVTEAQLPYYREHGYDIVEVDGPLIPDDNHTIGEDGTPDAPGKPERPGPKANKSELVAYADSIGVETEGLTVDQLKEAIDEHDKAEAVESDSE